MADATCSDVTLMTDSLKSRDISWHGYVNEVLYKRVCNLAVIIFSISRENRYLLLLTENYAALNAILSVLHEFDSEIEPYVLFGSGFPKDKEFTQVF